MFLRILIFFCFLGSVPFGMAAQETVFLVEDSLGSPVPGAILNIRGTAPGIENVSARTDSRGRVSLPVSFPAVIEVKAPGFDPFVAKLETVPDDVVVLRLETAMFYASVEVRIKDGPERNGSSEQSALTIERSGARTVYDAVDKLIPSAHVPGRGILGHGLGISNSIAIRGMGGSPTTQILVVIDGRPDAMGLMGHPIPDFYSLTDVGSIRITQGPASVRYGNRAMGGVIEIQPIDPQPGFHTELTAGLGSYYTGQDRLSHSGGFGKLRYQFAGGIGHTNGHRENSAFRDQDGALRSSYKINDVWKATVAGRYGHFTVEDPGPIQAPTPGNWARVGRGGYSIGLENRSETLHGTMSFFSSHGHHMLSDGFRSVDSNLGFRVEQTLEAGSGVAIDLGGDMDRYGGRARNIAVGRDFGEYYVTEGGGFTRIQWDPFDRLGINTGFRYEHNSVFGGAAAAEFGASYRLTEHYAMAIAVSRGFRNPTIRELYLFPAPTPTLQPESVWNYQVSFRFQPVSGFLAWATGYYDDVEDLIVTTGSFPNLKLANNGRASNRGLELNGRYRLSSRVDFTFGYAWFDSTNPPPYVPANKLIYSLDVDLSRAIFTFGGKTVGRTWADASRTIRLDGYTAATLKCTVPLGSRWSVFAAVHNLLNRQYMELDGYPMPGINASGGFRVRLDEE